MDLRVGLTTTSAHFSGPPIEAGASCRPSLRSSRRTPSPQPIRGETCPRRRRPPVRPARETELACRGATGRAVMAHRHTAAGSSRWISAAVFSGSTRSHRHPSRHFRKQKNSSRQNLCIFFSTLLFLGVACTRRREDPPATPRSATGFELSQIADLCDTNQRQLGRPVAACSSKERAQQSHVPHHPCADHCPAAPAPLDATLARSTRTTAAAKISGDLHSEAARDETPAAF